MPRYISHKVVWALKIGAIAGGPDQSRLVTIVPADTSFAPSRAAGFAAKHKPESGGTTWSMKTATLVTRRPRPSSQLHRRGRPAPYRPAHRYRLSGDQVLQFLKKERASIGERPNGAPVKAGEFVVTANGTTNEELIEVLLDRLRTINAQVPCRENSLAITKLEEAAHWLEARTRNRQARGVEGTPAT